MLTELKVNEIRRNILERVAAPDWTWEEACEMGLMARNARDISNWIIGEVAMNIQIKWGEDRLGDFARLLGFKKKTLEQYRWVVSKFGDNYDPNYGLPWSYYRLAAGTDKPLETMDKFIDDHMTYQQAENFIKGLPAPEECNHDVEEISYMRCKKCNKVFPKI